MEYGWACQDRVDLHVYVLRPSAGIDLHSRNIMKSLMLLATQDFSTSDVVTSIIGFG